MEDHGFGIDGAPVPGKKKWYKDPERWRGLLTKALIILSVGIIMVVFICFFDLIGEYTVRNEYIYSTEKVVITDIRDNTMRQYSDGKKIHQTEYLYYLDYVDTVGIPHRYEIRCWAPWLGNDAYSDSTCLNVGDTVDLYRFSSQGIFNMKGKRIVLGKGGCFYE